MRDFGWNSSRKWLVLFAMAGGIVCTTGFAQAQTDCPNGLRKINIGVAVSPPNVVHTVTYVAKELGIFAKHCVEANILQFDGGVVGAALTAVAQGTAMSPLAPAAISQGVRAKLIWGFTTHPPQSYTVSENVKNFDDLKGKRLSAAGGVGGFNWLMGREVLKRAGLKLEDATFLSQGTAGRLPGLLTGQLDGVVLHPEDLFIAQQKKPGTHVLISLVDLLPNMTFNSYGASNEWVARDRPLLRDTVTALIEATRLIYRDKEKVIPIMVKASEKPRDAVEFAYDFLTRNCIWAINAGFNRERLEWTIANDVANGDIDPTKKPSFEQVVDLDFAKETIEAAGGPVTINNCTE